MLREAGLVEEHRPQDDRRVRLYALRPEPVQAVAGWLEELSLAWQQQLDSFEDFVALTHETGGAVIAAWKEEPWPQGLAPGPR